MGPVNAADGRHAAKVDDTRGGTLGELLLVVASIGLLAVLAAPALVSYWRTSSLQGGARELASAINLGRQLAISRSTTVCVEVAGTNVRLRTGGCDGTTWTGPGTDGSGLIRTSNPRILQVTTTFLAEQKVEQLKAIALVDWTNAALDPGTTTEFCPPAGAGCTGTDTIGSHRRATTISNDPGGPFATSCKLVKVTVFYRPISARGALDEERRVDLFFVLASRT